MSDQTERKIDALRNELQEYHLEVREHIACCQSCRGKVNIMEADFYGVPGERGKHPGLIGDVQSLKKSRRVMLTALKGAWAFLLLLAGAVGQFFIGAMKS